MNIFQKLFGKKKKKEEEKKQESWYNDMHEGSLAHTATLPAGNGSAECTVAQHIAQN